MEPTTPAPVGKRNSRMKQQRKTKRIKIKKSVVDEEKEFKTRQRSVYHDMHTIVAKIMQNFYV